MSNLIATTIFVFAIYCAWAIAAYQPRPTNNPETPTDYFPEETAIAETQPQTITEPLPVATFKAPQPKAKSAPKAQLETLSIRQLKALAQERTGTTRAITGYSRLTKAQLVKALS